MKKLEDLMQQLEAQRIVDKKALQTKEQERMNMEIQLEMAKDKLSKVKEVVVHDSSRPEVKGKKIMIPDDVSFYDFVTLCVQALGMQEGPSNVYSESGQEIDELEQITRGDNLYLMPFFQ